MLRTLHLHGPLGQKFGNEFKFKAETPIQLIQGIGFQLKEFFPDIQKGYYRVLLGDFALEARDLRMMMGKEEHLHIIPVPVGQKQQGVGKIIIGAIIMTAAIVASAGTAAPGAGAFGGTMFAGTSSGVTLGATAFAGMTYGQIAFLGATMALAGAASMLSPTPRRTNTTREKPDQNPSALLNDAVNTVNEGVPYPLHYGRIRVGSHVISAGVFNGQIPIGELISENYENSSVYAMYTDEEIITPLDDYASGGMGLNCVKHRSNLAATSTYAVGAYEPRLFRNREVVRCQEVYYPAEDKRYLEFIVRENSTPQDYFGSISITSMDGSINYMTKFSASATNYTGMILYNRNRASTPSSGRGNRGVRWKWELGTGDTYILPLNEILTVTLSY